MGNIVNYYQWYEPREGFEVVYALPMSDAKLGTVVYEDGNGGKIRRSNRHFYLSIQDRKYIVRYNRTQHFDYFYLVLEKEKVATRVYDFGGISDWNYLFNEWDGKPNETVRSIVNGFRTCYHEKWKTEAIVGQVNVQNHYLRYK